jgi:hypothetical protein
MLSQDGEELEVLIDSFVHALHIPEVQRKIFRLRMASSDLTLQEDECTSLWNDVSAEFCEQKVDHVNIPLVDLWKIRLLKTFGWLRACLSSAEDVGEQFHDYSLRWRYDILGSGSPLAARHTCYARTHSDSLKAW